MINTYRLDRFHKAKIKNDEWREGRYTFKAEKLLRLKSMINGFKKRNTIVGTPKVP